MTPKEAKQYDTAFSNCWKRHCFVPFSGNGRKICRLYEVGQCKGSVKDKLSKKEEGK